MNFNIAILGQTVLRYEVPADIIAQLKNIYRDKGNEMPPANPQLVGKINDEKSFFYDGVDVPEKKIYPHNFLSKQIIDFYYMVFNHYLNWNKIRDYKCTLSSVWINKMKEHEYNPIHVHQGTLFTGLSSVLIVDVPQSYGVEYSSAHEPLNGQLMILGSSSGMFANIDYQPNKLKSGDLFIFPYDMRHCVYPFNGPGERLTVAANMDVLFDPIKNRGTT
tara:strand:+ start:738 stop:1394 length:657 start_codon:yes stop_codon:yes gene_type:complete